MLPTALPPPAGENFVHRLPEAQCAIAYHQFKCDLQSAPANVDQKLAPALGALAHADTGSRSSPSCPRASRRSKPACIRCGPPCGPAGRRRRPRSRHSTALTDRASASAVEIELQAFLETTAELKLPDGRTRVERHGFGPALNVATGIGATEVTRPKVRDRGATGADRIRFTSAILPLWARRTKSLDALLPILYLRGLSTGNFQEALSALLGKDAPNLWPSVISVLKAQWQGEYERPGRAVHGPRSAEFLSVNRQPQTADGSPGCW